MPLLEKEEVNSEKKDVVSVPFCKERSPSKKTDTSHAKPKKPNRFRPRSRGASVCRTKTDFLQETTKLFFQSSGGQCGVRKDLGERVEMLSSVFFLLLFYKNKNS